MLNLNPLPAYKRDVRKCLKRHWNLSQLNTVIRLIQEGGHEQELINKYDDHQLSGNEWHRAHDLHVVRGAKGDWLLIYRVTHSTNELTLVRTGTHKELLGK